MLIGGKITKSADGIKMTDELGKSTVISEDDSEDLPTAIRTTFQHFKQVRTSNNTVFVSQFKHSL